MGDDYESSEDESEDSEDSSENSESYDSEDESNATNSEGMSYLDSEYANRNNGPDASPTRKSKKTMDKNLTLSEL